MNTKTMWAVVLAEAVGMVAGKKPSYTINYTFHRY